MFGVVLIYRVLFVITYPLNDLAYDSANYLAMIMTHKAHLVHPGGYPFFMNLFFFWYHAPGNLADPLWYPIANPPSAAFIYALQFIQHSIELISLAVFFFCVSDIFNKWIAALALIFVGMDIDTLTFTNMTYPEWLQADLLILSLCAAYRAFVASEDGKKYLYYGVSFTLFVLCWVTKFNVLIFGLIFIPIYFAERSPRKRLMALAAGLSGAALFLLFLFGFHYPTTKSIDLTADKGWLLFPKLEWSLGNQKLVDAGLYTKRLIALNGVLPNRYGEMAGPFPFSKVDAVPAATRGPYREKYLWLLKADEPELDAFIKEHPLPKDFLFSYAFLPVSYYIGLKDSDDLATRVFFEIALRHLGLYVKNNLLGIWELGRTYPTEWRLAFGVMLPIAGRESPVVPKDSREVLKNVKDLGLGFVRYEFSDPPKNWAYPYLSTRPVLWKPGEKLFSLASELVMPTGILIVAVGLMFAYALVLLFKDGVTVRTFVAWFIALSIPGFIGYSNFSFLFRNKELRLIWPILGTAYSIGTWWLCTLGYQVLSRGRRRTGSGGGTSGASGSV